MLEDTLQQVPTSPGLYPQFRFSSLGPHLKNEDGVRRLPTSLKLRRTRRRTRQGERKETSCCGMSLDLIAKHKAKKKDPYIVRVLKT